LLSLSVCSLLFALHANGLIDAQQRQKAFADQKGLEKVFSLGDKILSVSAKYSTLNLKHAETNGKLLSKWIGSFEVVQVVGPVATVRVEDES
jgi:hypothetical protein